MYGGLFVLAAVLLLSATYALMSWHLSTGVALTDLPGSPGIPTSGDG